jgi:hypothetical protein
MWEIDDINTPESEAVQAERETWEAIVANDVEHVVSPTTGVALDECDRCGKRRELFHNEATGLALCDECDRITDEVEALVPVEQTVRFKKLRNGAWGVTGPSALLREGEIVAVTKRNGSTTTVRVGRVLWSGDGKAICTTRRA